jgi:hypothetical protein
MSDEAWVTIVAIGCGVGAPMLVGLVAVVMSHWQKVRVSEQQTTLKRELLDRGFTADEIIRVIEAGAAAGESKDHKPARCH